MAAFRRPGEEHFSGASAMISVFQPRGAARAPVRNAVSAVAVSVILAGSGFAQEAGAHHASAATPLAELLMEAEQDNPQIRAAQQGTQAAREVPAQVSTLPDPMFQFQQVNVGSPRPFAGYTNSEFSYIGLGTSQDLPYPGKLRLRGEIARRDADIADSRADSVSRGVFAEIKAAYYQLAYLSQTLVILINDQQLLKQVEQAADARYRSGLGNQQDILQAQIQQTKLLRDISMHHLEAGKLQTRLKQLVSRSQSTPDIEPVPLKESPLSISFEEILAAAETQNPDLAATQHTIERQALQVQAARKDFKPDFNAQFMWQRTDPTQFRAYYQITVGVKIPLHYGKQRAELAQAQAELSRSRSDREAQSQQLEAELRQQYLIAQQSAELLQINRDGLIPQTRTGFQSGLAAYQNNRQDFQALLTSYLDIFRLEQENTQTLADHETAIARLEQMTGLSLAAPAKEKE
jgi:cobalt-zinc-cadmium efflux system outer membrane protein